MPQMEQKISIWIKTIWTILNNLKQKKTRFVEISANKKEKESSSESDLFNRKLQRFRFPSANQNSRFVTYEKV
ncbi:hypothetical protein Avbf_18281 [Armadillidium vulgare]|nr:hypothetical protein Avbf_18281 [Armadillidium vulgare]